MESVLPDFPDVQVDSCQIAVLTDQITLWFTTSCNDGEGLALEGGRPMQATAAAAAQLFLRSEQGRLARAIWWEVPEGTVPQAVCDALAEHLHRPRPRGEQPHAWLKLILGEGAASPLIFVTEAQRLLRGPGSRTLYRLWYDLIRFEPGLLVLVGEGLVPGLFTGEAERSLKPYMMTVRWERLAGEWGRTYPLPKSWDVPAADR